MSISLNIPNGRFAVSETKEHILSTALKLFFHKGFKGVTMSELVEVSGMSKGAFYHYFSSKEELYDLSMELFLDKFLESYRLEINESLSLKDNLKEIYNRFTPLLEQLNTSTESAAEGLSNYLIFLQSVMKKPEFRKKMEDYNHQFYHDLSTWIAEAQASGVLKRNIDPHILGIHIAGLMKGVSVLYAFADQSSPASETFNLIIDQLFDQVETSPN